MRLSGLRLLLAATAASAVANAQYAYMNYYSTDPSTPSYVQPGGIATDQASGASCVTGAFQ